MPSQRTLTLALVASVALNLFVIGAVVGAVVLGHRAREVHGADSPRQPLWRAADTLRPEHQRAYRQLLRGEAGRVGGQMRQARQARREAWNDLGGEPLDGPAISRRLTEARALEMTARGGVEDRIVAFAATLPPAERAELAKGLARSGPGGRRQGPDRDRP
ncbi:MAG: periplasmic heavy metal sensor [Phenylobacterium sp.]|uniref:periplasmic heavy metal sensor n=1 Tax=Phenylobacterium sp. TaxID=1871053 RepID=UPI001B3F5F9B|nr:periplasmic heavy metal sensor [Phenylobacterium sp.]MBP7649180.1 periplasmic heavy metal sensor [Phenylobacterium sp.]MBP7816103.1 periplasmic heavy metal sensor [Phenylobacterium sp.]MBP9230667.1 periplasmic heavy metal sensor [Phenylobacterium sp.]MBP9753703.1 periplasmic heavy metal sensor [Phenylobacterium sp.]